MPNRLAEETSPYLLQHANNPVDWQPWGPAAFERARAENKPIFLSIGYSACHWCHVMEHESFEDPDIARFLNDNFVSIKVDREERPDLDQIYMQAVQAMTGRGGWPMSVFLTADLKPFYGGTYWPPSGRMGMPGFDDVLAAVRRRLAQPPAGCGRTGRTTHRPSASGGRHGASSLERSTRRDCCTMRPSSWSEVSTINKAASAVRRNFRIPWICESCCEPGDVRAVTGCCRWSR